MTADELRALMSYLRERVRPGVRQPGGLAVVTFDAPTEQEMTEAGLDPEGAKRILAVPWWDEMVADIVETPELCDPDDPEAQVLDYARDVVSEYIRKRFPLEGE